MTESTPLEHTVIPRRTDFLLADGCGDMSIQDIYAALVADEARNGAIVRDVIRRPVRQVASRTDGADRSSQPIGVSAVGQDLQHFCPERRHGP